MTARELRQKYLRFFESKGHTIYPSGSLIPVDVTGKLDESLLFNGAGMVQFKPFFRGVAEPPNRRLTTAQKCVRTGDIEDVGDLSHLTFFEMLGNFSFGDYFKREAIDYSWEFLTDPEWLGLDPRRLSFTVFEEDDAAFDRWAGHVVSVGLDPNHRIFRLGEESNYWPAGAFSSGPPGPCGPNSEMFYWVPNDVPPPTGAYTTADWLRDDEAKNWLEVWNDVFIQFEWKGRLRNPERTADGYEKLGMDDLPFQSIDTGMGLERTVAVLNGFRSVYQTDAFSPILRILAELHGDLDLARVGDEETPTARAVRVIADHIRTACFCIADGILPANNGRGYVLRRLIRRAVLKGLRTLGFDQPFFHLVYEGVAEAMGEHYAELIDRREIILETLQNEEALFRRTLNAGSAMLQGELESLGQAENATRVLGGAVAFRLYDTYGFPLEVTKELCAEAGVEVDQEGFEIALKQAQELSRGSSDMDSVYGGLGEDLVIAASPKARNHSVFVGYDRLEHSTEIVQVSPRFGPDGLTNGQFQLCLDESPFYAESGGQVGDTGIIRSLGRVDFEFRVTNTWKEMGLIWCDAELASPEMPPQTAEAIGEQMQAGDYFQPVLAIVDAARRRRIIRNHSATHLLHAALREVLGKHVTQAGSLVSPDYLRFDFTHGKAMTEAERMEVEAIVNAKALEGIPVQIHADLPLAEAKRRGAMALFGEKYGDRVRMVEMGPFSLELCGGCHVAQTSEIGLFVIAHESSAASGVRRIEALTGEAAYAFVREQRRVLEDASDRLKSTPMDLLSALDRTLDTVRDERKKVEQLQRQLLSGGGAAASGDAIETLGEIRFWAQKFEGIDPKIAAEKVDNLVAANADLVAVAAIVVEGKVNFVAKAGPLAVQRGAHAGNLVKEAAKVTGGGGGGRPDFATAGGKDPSKVDDALAAVRALLAG